MAAGLSLITLTLKPLNRSSSSSTSRLNHPRPAAVFPPSLRFNGLKRRKILTVCFVVEERKQRSPMDDDRPESTSSLEISTTLRLLQKAERKKSERFTYLIAAIMSSFGITSMAIMAVYYRFSWQMKFCFDLKGSEVSVSEMFGTFALSVGAAVGMEFWARWAHRALWHASLWNMHESHHKPREGAFELNDVFAIINAVPAISLLNYGFFNKGLVPGLCFGAGLGITVFGIAYMFVHDGLVHKRFPVGPIANVPYLRKVAAAHQLHHTDKFKGIPYGLFLGPKEVEEVGGKEELEKTISRRIKLYNKGSTS
ncbi:beta-carotene 3-hydroxylase 2, chloroplastic [Eutrema salsugineum]|uniref:beta-carotene 3-hydroxylase 2, chloroplastic n=1 Tax=Eutrema salsugineum TaxID=72664 RepID=UPI000CED2F4E|nr:beta-carotene 3-hydroxylase 2, chloroplastic [Eutrema salsugineum]